MLLKTVRLNSINVRLFLWFLIPTLILLLMMTGIFYFYSSQQLNTKITEISRKNVLQAIDNLSLLTQGYDSMSKSITANSDVQRVLSDTEATPALQLINERVIISELEAVFNSRSDLVGLHIIAFSGKIYSYEASTPVYKSFDRSPWYEKIRKSQGEMIWLGMREPTLTAKDEPVFSFGRLVYDLYSREPLGVLLVEASPKPILSMLSNLHMGTNSQAYVVDSAGSVLAQQGMIDELMPSEAAAKVIREKGDAHLASSTEGPNLIVVGDEPQLGWTITGIIPKSNFQVQLEEANRFFLLVLFCLLTASIILATILSRTISAPIIRLVREMKVVERGNLNAIVEMRSFEEMNYLAANFNSMIDRVKQLVERVRIATASEKNAQIHALQSQVNPHFLYNTLDMIYWELDESKQERLGEIVLSLSRMFRYSSEWEHSDVTLREELDQTQHYLHIIQARSSHALEIRIEIPDEWQQVSIPKMTLQPLIENAVIHGLSRQERAGIIRIDLEAQEQDLVLRIQDNGIGIPSDRLAELQQSLEQATELESDYFEGGIGLMNVHRRLILKFGQPYGLKLASCDNGGTTVTIRLPRRTLTAELGGEST
ncbi:sensor histidine kinase [Paenibacillus cremeus]|uniref:histidine kinase n=1 Tax=Paenibacillus cremeus TaxID=2163881 RepID=A0A559K4I9_9BACL|nr:sensor histidine kinase [Paenibacillus cremeus]TVY06993.1 sensor histidine kinase [Paenibacillus cremeus]